MNKKKAIEIMRQQLDALDVPGVENSGWMDLTKGYVRQFLGPDHSLTKVFESGGLETVWFAKSGYGRVRNSTSHVGLFKEHVSSVIQVIEHNGLYKTPKKNFLSKLDQKVIWGILLSIMTTSFSAGWWFGSSTKAGELQPAMQELRFDNKLLRSQMTKKQLVASDSLKLLLESVD